MDLTARIEAKQRLIDVAAGRAPADLVLKDVRYVNVVGSVSDTPFQGANIIVVRYSDGTVRTAKVLF